MSGLLVFNPDHEYALAHGGKYYQSPASIKRLSTQLELLPLVWGDENDFILKADNTLFSVATGMNMECNPTCLDCISFIKPWGWNSSLCTRLSSIGINEKLLPDEEWLLKIRQLSHRRISILCNDFIGSSQKAVELFNLDDALEFAAAHPGCYFKMPWSSGGRGVVATEELNPNQIREWINGCIKKQKSVLAEIKVDRVIDFASLWTSDSTGVHFDGFSVSISDGRGKYKGNVLAGDEDLLQYIKQKSPAFEDVIIEKQKEFIATYIHPLYIGKIGIDMMADKAHMIAPCSEINLRPTMGHVALIYRDMAGSKKRLLQNLKLPLIPLETL